MTSHLDFVSPPSVAIWLLNLFAFGEKGESILGDLLEEFSFIVAKSGVSAARRWYWRQTVKTVPRLASFGFRTAPWVTAAAVAGGFLLRKLVGPLVGTAMFAVLERCQVFFERHFDAYMFFASTGLDICHLFTFLCIGFFVALAAREREMVATMALGLIFGAMAVFASVYIVTRFRDGASLWRLTWYFADAFAVVIAGAIVRTHRLAAVFRHSVT